jgi:hypothetical protein
MATVVVVAGRRVDAPGTISARFPEAESARVRSAIGQWLEGVGATTLVCAAACGADLLALEIAGRLGIRRRILLPFGVAEFRASSVVDRPGGWGERYDQIVAEVEAEGDLLLHSYPMEGDGAYFQTNLDLFREAEQIAATADIPVLALVVWEGHSRGPQDVTAHFLAEAQYRGLPVHQILTLSESA